MSPVEAKAVTQSAQINAKRRVYRVDVLPLKLEFAQKITLPGVGDLYASPVYWFQADALIPEMIETIAQSLLIDPILQRFTVSTVDEAAVSLPEEEGQRFYWLLEKQFLPGVTDNLGKTVEKSISLLFPQQSLPEIRVASGEVYWAEQGEFTAAHLLESAKHQLFNPLVQRLEVWSIEDAQSRPERYTFPQVHTTLLKQEVETIVLDLSDDDLLNLSQSRNLALTLDEMHVIREYYTRQEIQESRKTKGLPMWPTDVELEIFAQTWSEHCKHKIFAASIEYTDASNPDYPETYNIHGLFKTFIAGSTERLQEKRSDLLSVFKDNAGVMQWNQESAICFKAETHNSPSALEPYGGALTGIVGVNRDILGTGMGAKPLFNTDVFCFAHPDEAYAKRPTMLPPEAILQGVRKGVEDGGNKSGIPTVNGALVFDARYRAKPLVFCGTGGVLPLDAAGKIGYKKYTQPGDTIVMAGGRVGKDGIHGATFSSEALHQDSPVSAVQIGDPITQKRMSDFLMEARDQGLITGITDNGAGGLSSSVGEMATITGGATLHLERVPLKYAGLAPYEIVISESQERMTMSTQSFEALNALAKKHDVELSAIGEFHNQGTFDIVLEGQVLASLSLDFLHDGLPKMQLKAHWMFQKSRSIRSEAPRDTREVLLKLLASPNICSREALIRQYDHEVQGRSVIKPLMGKLQTAPCDAAVLQPILGQPEGLVVSNGICPQFSDWDTYHMAACAVDEAVRNAVAVGADPKSIVLLDNFCWPDPLPSSRNPDAEFKLGQLVRANQALYDMALSYETPLISGKDSMKNDFDDGEFRLSIPPTLLVSAMGKLPDINKAVSMEFKAPGDLVFLLGKTNMHLGASQYYTQMGWYSPFCPQVEKPLARRIYQAVHECMMKGWIRSCHDLSEGGLAVALAESAFGGEFGVRASLYEVLEYSPELRWDEALFSETAGRLLISLSPQHFTAVTEAFHNLPLLALGAVTEAPIFELHKDEDEVLAIIPTEELRRAWCQPPAKCYASGIAP
jgi:phosphoribosylformylglycinamidine synthase subunit PurSL